MLFDQKTGTNLLQWPVEEVESLRLSSDEYAEVVVTPGSIVPLNITQATQVLSIAFSKLSYYLIFCFFVLRLFLKPINFLFVIKLFVSTLSFPNFFFCSWTYLLNLRLNH